MENMIETVNPYTGKTLEKYNNQSFSEALKKLARAKETFNDWRLKSISDRNTFLSELNNLLNKRIDRYAKLMSEEMGKPITQSRAELEKCSKLIDFYIANSENFLADRVIQTEAKESFISYDPLGVILAIMPWNYPFWQVFRFAIPTLTAGNTVLLKHAANVTGCALAIEELFEDAGYPKDCFNVLLCNHEAIEKLIAQDDLKAVSLTGSEKAGKKIAEIAGKHLKKCVLELGGNNACIILNDADLDTHIDTIVNARMQNSGQSCIAAKRFIVQEGIYDLFISKFTEKAKQLKYGNPLDEKTEIGPLARKDLAENLKEQVDDSLNKGARLTLGNTIENAYFEPTILESVEPGMPAFDEETFGPVAAFTKVKTEEEAYEMAIKSRFGLGCMIFTKDADKAKKQIIKIEDGAFFINEMVKSHPQLPFGGTKASGYGRELSQEGILEFVNKKTIYIN